METIRIREATVGDLGALLDLMEAFNAFEHIAWNRTSGEPALRALILDNKLGRVGLIEDGGAIVGYFVLTWGYDLEWNGRDAFLTELFLAPEARGRGLGTFALREAQALAKSHAARAMHLLVRHENEPARRLYASAGFASPPRLFLTKRI